MSPVSRFQQHFVHPAGYLIAALGQQYRISVHVFGMWLDSFASGTLTRRADMRLVMRCRRDLIRAVPTIAFAGFPAALPVVPLLAKWGVSALPSTFLTNELIAHRARKLCAKRLPLLGGIQRGFERRLSTGGATAVSPIIKKAAVLFTADSGVEQVSEKRANVGRHCPSPLDWSGGVDFFARNGGLNTLSWGEARQWARYLDLSCPSFLPKTRLYRWADWIAKDDALIRHEGVLSLSKFELIEAIEERGFSAPLAGLNIEGDLHELRDVLTRYLMCASKVQAAMTAGQVQEAAKPSVFAAFLMAYQTSRPKA